MIFSKSFFPAFALLLYISAVNAQPAQWQCIGPDTMPAIGGDGSYFLSYTQGIGRTHCIRFHPLYGETNKTTYVGTPRGGLWRSHDGKGQWQELNTSQLPVIGIADLVFDPADMNHMYIATGNADNGTNPNEAADGSEDTQCRGIFESVDGGKTWSNTAIGTWHDEQRQQVDDFWAFPSRKVMRQLYIHQERPDLMGAIIYRYNHKEKTWQSFFYRSEDKGRNWFITLSVFDESFQDIESKPGHPDILYISGKNLYRSADAGVSWQEIVSDQFPADSTVSRCKVATCAAAPDFVYAHFVVGRVAKLYISTDEGATFKLAVEGLGSPAWRTSLAVDPGNPHSVYYSGGNDIYRFAFSDSAWTSAPASEHVHVDIHELTFSPDGKKLYASSDGGAYTADTPGVKPAWKYISNGIGNAMVWRLGTSATNPPRIVAGLQDCGTVLFDEKKKSPLPQSLPAITSSTWSIVRGGDGAECFFDYTNDSIVYHNDGQNNVFARSDDGGRKWINITPRGQRGDYIKPALLDPVDPGTVYVGFHDIYKSNDKGKTWRTVSDFSSFGIPVAHRVHCIAVAPSDTAVMYAAFSQPTWSEEMKGKVFRTTNGGISWQDITQGLIGVMHTSITCIAVDPHDADVVYVGFRGAWDFKVMRSTSGGSDWENFSDGLPGEADVNVIVTDKRKKGSIYIGTHFGVYEQKNSYSGWMSFNEGIAGLLPRVRVNDLEINYASSELYAATVGRGVWKTALQLPDGKKQKKRRR